MVDSHVEACPCVSTTMECKIHENVEVGLVAVVFLFLKSTTGCYDIIYFTL